MISNTSLAGSGGSEFESNVASLSFSSLFQVEWCPSARTLGSEKAGGNCFTGWWRSSICGDDDDTGADVCGVNVGEAGLTTDETNFLLAGGLLPTQDWWTRPIVLCWDIFWSWECREEKFKSYRQKQLWAFYL